MKDRQSLLNEFEQLLPLAAEWATAEEARILSEGVALSPNELADARAAGVEEPEKIRLLRVESVPLPAQPQLRAAAEAVHFLTPETRGLTLRYGIFVRWDCWQDRHLLAHEFGHTAQYERAGSIAAFLQQYLMQCLTIGYANAPMELEVEQIAHQICAA